MTAPFAPFHFLIFFLLVLNPPTSSLSLHPHDLEKAVHNWLHWPSSNWQGSPPAAHPRANHAALQRELPSWVVGAGNWNGTAKFPLPYPRLMMHKPEADLIASYLRPSDVFLEFGSGASTLAFAKLVKVAFAIEHDCGWVRYLEREMKDGDEYGNLRIRCVEVKPGERNWGTWSAIEHGNYDQFKEYVEGAGRFGEKFDKVFIDGRARVGCALRVLPHLKEDGLVFLHDFYARLELYGKVLDYYEEVASVRAVRNMDIAMGPVDEAQGLVVLRKKKGVEEVTVEEVQKVYSKIEWRKGFGEPVVGIGGWLKYFWAMTDWKRWQRARNVEMLVRMVKGDVIRMILVYGVVIFLLEMRKWGKGERVKIDVVGKEKKSSGEIRYVETEGMKAANARRKGRMTGGKSMV